MQVSIRPFELKDIGQKVQWINDASNNKFLHYELPLTREKTRRWFISHQGSQIRRDMVIQADGHAVGILGLLAIEKGSAEYYVTLGESSYKGKGIAKQASKLLLKDAFQQLSLKKVYAFTEVRNIAAQRLFEHCGFKQKKLCKGSAINRGKSVDRYYYEITKQEFENQ